MTNLRVSARPMVFVLLVLLIVTFPSVNSFIMAQGIHGKAKKAMKTETEAVHRTIDNLSKGERDKVEALITALLQKSGGPGLEVAIQKKGKTIYEAGFGSIVIGKKVIPPGPDTRFQIDSLTKAFTAFAVLHLAEQGAIDLDKPMDTYPVSLPNKAWGPMPVRYYLGMITGIPDDSVTKGSYKEAITRAAEKKVDFSPKTPRGQGLGPEKRLTQEHLVGLDFVPAGSQFDYSDVNYFILGDLVSAKSPAKSFMKYTKNNILTPLGMNDTGFIEFGHGDLWPTAYGKKGQVIAPRAPDSGFSGGGFVSTMSDLEKFGGALYNRAILNAKSYKEMWSRTKLTSGANKGNTINFGLGWDDVDVENGDLVRVSKNGGGWGWGSQLTFFPKSEYCVILLQNSQRGNLIKAAIDIGNALTTK